jgi:hypothetical protein
MKTRNGFVSNSSSSSYIVKINGLSYEHFVEVLLAEYTYFLEERGLKKIQFNINKMLQDLEKSKENDPLLPEWYIKQYDMWTKSGEEDLATIKKLTEEDNRLEIMKFILLKNDIRVENAEGENAVRLSAFVSMHNDFGDMPELLREIILFFMFDTTYEVECERESDNDLDVL